jgi:hypothetical protein
MISLQNLIRGFSAVEIMKTHLAFLHMIYRKSVFIIMHETTAFSVMKKITTNPPILSHYEKYLRDISDAKKLTKPCGS